MKTQHLITSLCTAFVLFFTSCVQENYCECQFTDLQGTPQTEAYSYDGDETETSSYCSMKEDDLDDIYTDASCSVQ